MKVLVAGGAGFIGSHSCKALSRAGHEVIVYDNLSTGHLHAARWGAFERGDIRDRQRLDEVFAKYRPQLVMHFAALAYVGDSVREPSRYYDVNVGGTLTLLDAMRDSGVSKIVFSSTCATYGIPEKFPIVESSPQEPVNPYGFTKLAVERMLADFEEAYRLRSVSLRYFNAAGADPDGELGEEHVPETHALPLAIRAALGDGPSFSILGQDFDTEDGSAVRDYVHVSDLAAAHVLAAEYLFAGSASVALNLGTGVGTSVLQLLNSVAAVVGRDVPVRLAPRRPGDPPILYASADRARQVLGWTPQFTRLDDIVDTAFRWFARTGESRAA